MSKKEDKNEESEEDEEEEEEDDSKEEEKKENEFMKDKIENVNNLLIAEKEDNFNLKNKFQNFYNKYRLYKDTTTKKTTALENMLLKLKNKQKECKIFHIRKGNSAIKIMMNHLFKELCLNLLL